MRHGGALPYCVSHVGPGSLTVLNRRYVPVGIAILTGASVERVVRAAPYWQDPAAAPGYLFNDASAPWHCGACLRSYMPRLQALAAAAGE